MRGRGRNLGKNTRTDGCIHQGDTLKHTFTKKYHNVSSGVSPKAENEVQQQMSAFAGWLRVIRRRKQASGKCLIIESDPNFFPKIPGICYFFQNIFFLKYQLRLGLMDDATGLPNVLPNRPICGGKLKVS